ncbi:MAG TPA: PRC-barrel domain-containing protein [Azospirillaceae bacterium]|nr:PRC-barrel domain-containing protein [Azospirillaceae bacterium]
MRPALPTAAILLAGSAILAPLALAQTQPTPVPVPAGRAEATAPLTTGTRPGDIPTTDAAPVKAGPDGDAPTDDRTAGKTAAPPASPPVAVADPAPAPTPAATAQGAALGEPGPVRRLTAREAEMLLGRTVLSSDGESVGSVRDFLTAGTDSRIQQMVIGSGGILGLGRSLIAVPIESVALDHGTAADSRAPLRLTLSAADVEARERFRYDGRANAMVGPR